MLADLSTVECPFSAAPPDMPLALYGAGSLGRLARDFLKAVGHDFVMAIDCRARQLREDPEWAAVQLLHPNDVADSVKRSVRVAVSVATSPYVPIERSLSEQGFTDIVPFYDMAESFRHVHPLSNGWFAPPMTAKDRENAIEVMTRWNDDLSRAHHLQFIAWRRLREEWTFDAAPVSDDSRFFIPEVANVLQDDEILLDAGAYHGNVSKTFVNETNGQFRQIVAIEPDPANRGVLERNLRSWLPCDPRVTVLDCALDADAGEAPFHEGLGYASQLSATGRLRVAARPLDALGLSPSFVKFHLEGAEHAALKGAHQTLLSHRPIIAATVYHNADGIWRTPLWLMKTLPDYRFLFRNHSWCGTGAVVYALPNERHAV
jgi:FkbM family methyltransferase